jgi:benzoyl-CoA-dihydrodiol lyase
VVDKRKVRRDLADVFSSLGEGVKGKRAVQWRLVDETVPLSKFPARIAERAKALAERSAEKKGPGVTLEPLGGKYTGRGPRAPLRHRWPIDAGERVAHLTVRGTGGRRAAAPGRDARAREASSGRCAHSASWTTRSSSSGSTGRRSAWWSCRRAARPPACLAVDAALEAGKDDWFVNEVRST